MGSNNKNVKNMPYVDPESKVRYGMKWHKFLCVFLFVSAALAILGGVLNFMGHCEYQWLYDMGKEADIFAYGNVIAYIGGTLTFISVPLALIARHKLAKLQKSAPLFYYIYLIVGFVARLIEGCAAIVVYNGLNLDFSSDDFSMPSVIIGLVVEVGYIMLMMLYYNNRKVYFDK